MASANQKNGQQITPYGILLSSSLTANLALADNLGLFSPEGLDELRRGKSATITKGEYAGQEATADHFIPRSVCPELDNQIYNLRLLPSKLNSSKGDKVEREQVDYAEELHRNGLLSQGGLDAVQTAYKKVGDLYIVLPPTPAPLTQEERDKAERENQLRMAEESRQMELEVVRAERKGLGAVYELRKERTILQAKRANKSKTSSDVLIFERMVNETLEALSRSIDKRGFTYRMPSDNPNRAGDWVPKHYMMNDEARELERLLDEPLRAK